MALKQRGLAGSVVGFVRRNASVRECQRLGAVDLATMDLQQAAADSDLIILCTPIAQMRPLMEQLRPALKPRAVVTDVGSVKGSVVRELESLAARAGAHFVGSHPMAGAEKMGVSAARADLFLNAVTVVTPTLKTNKGALRKIESLWKAVGSRVLRLSPELHDQLVSRSSHLPHVTAAVLTNFVLNPKHHKAQPALCANGFRDTTRIASGSPEMWRDIALANRKHLLASLQQFSQDLRRFQKTLQRNDSGAITKFFARAKQNRDAWAEQLRSPSPE